MMMRLILLMLLQERWRAKGCACDYSCTTFALPAPLPFSRPYLTNFLLSRVSRKERHFRSHSAALCSNTYVHPVHSKCAYSDVLHPAAPQVSCAKNIFDVAHPPLLPFPLPLDQHPTAPRCAAPHPSRYRAPQMSHAAVSRVTPYFDVADPPPPSFAHRIHPKHHISSCTPGKPHQSRF
ncbi:hypothetical protein F5887DRAFT_1004892 [Amanita rubescens]|nr:hypothetical protein F5887DRAFT_1004892 [Amanita rubescens]